MSIRQDDDSAIIVQGLPTAKESVGDTTKRVPTDEEICSSTSKKVSSDNVAADTKNLALAPHSSAAKASTENDLHRISDCLCPNCGDGNAATVMLPTTIPGFREILVMTLTCEGCAFRNSQVTFSGEIQPQGQLTTWTVPSFSRTNFLNRQILKSDSATVGFPTLDDLEIPSTTQQGVLTTVEGLLQRAKVTLAESQPDRLRLGDVDNFHRCRQVIEKIETLLNGDENEDISSDENDTNSAALFPFQLIINDPAGNSFLENPHAPKPDPQVRLETYQRTSKQDVALGLQPSVAAQKKIDESARNDNPQLRNAKNNKSFEVLQHDVPKFEQEGISIPTTCPQCNRMIDTKMCTTKIPHFQEIILFCSLCEHCGYRSNEIKNGGGIPSHGSRWTLKVSSLRDLKRDVLKSDTAGIEVPEIDFEMSEGSLGGVYTTVEGLLQTIRERLLQGNPFAVGDSTTKHHASNDGEAFSKPDGKSERFQAFLRTLHVMAKGKELPFTLIITDPLASSYIGPSEIDNDDGSPVELEAPCELRNGRSCTVDSQLQLDMLERSVEQDENLGIADMNTENYRS